MRRTCYLLAILVIFIPSCEKKPTAFDVSLLPGGYRSHAYVYRYTDSIWGSNSTIPPNYTHTHEGYISEIMKISDNQYSISFMHTDPMLPDEIQVEITRFHEFSEGAFKAYIKVTENEHFKDTILDQSLWEEYNWFRHLDYSSTVYYNITLKSKTQDDLIMECWGTKK